MMNRKASSIIDDMILQRLLSTSTDDKAKIELAERKLEELKQELEDSLRALVRDYTRGIKDGSLR